MQDIVVILPGITGSVLQKDGKDIWAVSGQAIWQALSRSFDSLQDLMLYEDDAEAENLEDGIQATQLISDTHLIPGLVKILDGYTAISRLVTDNFIVTPGDIYKDLDEKEANFYHFPYDWRRDNRANARLLKRLIDKRLQCWRQYTGIKDAKVILLAHSMGGLISRYYVEVLEGWRDCKALFTFGTPHRGSVNSLDFLANGYKQMFLDLTELMRSFTSVYQLLPIYKMLKVGNEYHRIAEIGNIPNVNQEKARNALAFHREIEAAVEEHQKDENYRNSYRLIPMLGMYQPTLQSAELVNGKLTVSHSLPKWINDPLLSHGDGTVPYLSAIPIELSNDYRETYVAEKHSSIQNHKQILNELRNRLKAMQRINLQDARGPEINQEIAEKPAISLSLDDLYLAGESIQITAKVINFNQDFDVLEAQITPIFVEGDQLNLNFEQQNDEWVLTIDDSAPGLYRLRVETDIFGSHAPSAVNDVFEVV